MRSRAWPSHYAFLDATTTVPIPAAKTRPPAMSGTGMIFRVSAVIPRPPMSMTFSRVV
jgi:hypothetical protein